MNSSSSLFAWARAVICLLLTGAAFHQASAQSTSTNIISGSIGVPGEQDVYTFNVASRARYYFDSLTNVNSIYWTLEGPSGVVVARRAFASTDAGSFTPITLPPGFYRLTIDADNSITNSYAFRFVDLATASLLIPGTQVNSTLSPGPETDLYQFTSAAGDRLFFDQQTTPPGMNIWWRLIDPYGNQVFSGGFSDVNNVTQRVAGVYHLLVEGYSANNIAGAYSFTVVLQGNTPPPALTGTPMAIGQIISGSLTNVATNDFTFSLGAETRVVFDNLTNGPSVQWSLEGPPGLIVNNPGINSTDGPNGATNLELPAGNYQLRVRHSTAGTAGYRFRLLDLGAGSSVTPGTPILAALSPASETDVYRFTASAGSRYFFDAYSTNGTGNAYWRLYDPNNVLVTQNSLHSDRGPLTLSISGTYTLTVEGYYDEAGTASVPYRFDVTPITDAVQTLTVGSVTTGAIATPGQSQQYLFSLGAATSLYFDSRTNILRWSLDGPSGNYVNNRAFTSSDGANNSDPRLPLPAGDYTLTVSGSGDATGGFAFRLIDAASATPITPGTPFSSTLSPANETDAYRFTAAAGSKAYFDAVSVNNLPNVYWRCVDSFGTMVFWGTLSDRGPILLEAGGNYTLLVEGYYGDPGSGSYTINVLPVVDGMQALTLGEVVSGAIATPGQAQNYTFTLATTTALYFDVLTNNSSLRWSLQGSVGTIVNNRGFTSTDAHNGYAVLNLVAGTYTVTISANGDNTGGYHFRLFDLAPSAPISPGVPVAGTLNPASQTDSYRFTLSAGTKVYFDAITSSGLANVYWRCVDPYGAVVMGNGFSDAGPMILPAGGIYTLVIEGHYPNTDSGTYSFNVVPVNDGSQTLTLGNVVTGQIAVPGQSQRYQFSLPAAATLYLDTLTNSTMRWSLEGPAGLLVNNRGFTSTDANNGYAGLSLLPGDYVLTVNGSGEATGPYQFRVLDLASATPMVLGTPVSSSLTPATETDMYRFTVAAGTEVFFDAVAANGIANHYWRCVDPNGAILLVNGFTDFGPVVLQVAGTYTLLMEGYYLNTGSGTYSLNVVPVNDTSPAMTPGNLTSGTIAVPGQSHAYRFTLPASTTLYFDSRTNDSNLRWHLDGPEGRLVNNRGFSGSDAQSIGDPLLSLSPGDYTLTVFASADATGAFAFRLFDLATATALTPGTPVNTTLAPGNETDAYRFTAAAGDRFSFRWLSQTGIPNSYWRLFDPYGNRIFGSGTTDMGTNRLIAAGTYTLLVEGYIADVANGSYQFNVSFVDNVPVSLTGTPLTIGSTVSSNLAAANTTNSFIFTLASPTRLFFDSLVNADFRWTLTGPPGDLVANRSFQGSDGIDLADSSIQCPAGNYRLNVTGAAGAYSFRLLDAISATVFTPGVVTSNSLAPARSTALHRFNANIGERFYFDGRPSTGFGLPPYVKIYGPYGIVLPSQQVSTDAEIFVAPHTGSYVVSVEGRYNENGASGNYSFLLQPVVDGTNTIAVGSLVVGTIAVPGQRQTHRLNLAAPARLLFDSLSNVTFRWTLTGPAGVVVDNRALDNSDSYEFDALLNLPAGDYRMVVDAPGDAVGGYAFRFIDVSSATPLTLGAIVNGSLAPGNSSVIYRFNANAGDRFYFDGRPTSGFTYTPYLRIYSPLGQVVLGQQAVNSDLDVFTMPYTGSYLLTVEGRWLETSPSGNFSFALQPVVDGTNTLAVDATFAGVIATPGQRQFHYFNLPSPRRMLFDSLSNVGLRWTLTGPPGVIVSARTFDNSDSYEIDAMLNLPSGDYVVEVDGSTDATNSYAFRFVDSASAAAFTPGNVVSNSLLPGNSTTLYRFNAAAGDRFYFDGRPTSGFTYSPYLRLYSPLGAVVFGQQAVTTDLETFVVPHSGSYLLSVEGRYLETSVSNQFSFLLQPVVDGTNAITVGQRVNGIIGVTGQRQYYTLNLPAPRQLLFDSLSNVTLRWTLVGPSGTLVNNRALDSSDSYEIDALMNLPAGDYLMKVDGNASAVGGYAFRFIDTATAVAFTPGTLVTNSLVPGNSSTIYRFNAAAGERFYFDGRTFTGSPYSPYSRIYSPLGAIVLNYQAVNSDAETFPVLETGTFLVTVEGRYIDASPTNSFSFLLAPNPSQAPTPLFETNVAPDLSVIGVAMTPPSGLQSGQSATVQWTTRNTGTAATPGSFVERVTVRNIGTSQIIVNRTLPYDELVSGPILPSQTRARQLIVTLPDGPASVGNLEVTVTTDALNNVFEQNAGGTAEANNATSINTTTTLAPYPDLQIASLNTMPVAAWTTGSVVSVSWVVTNSGTRATAGSWTESLLVRNTNTAQIIVNTTTNYAEAEPGNGPIAPNGTRTRSLSFVMPMNANAAGAFEVVLTTDSENQIFEYNAGGTAETNNARSLLSASAPDLVVNTLTATGEPSLQAGSNLRIQWNVANQGNVSADGTFYDRIVVRNTNTAEVLLNTSIPYTPTQAGNGAIQPGGSRPREYLFAMPEGSRAVGRLEVTVTSDVFNSVPEHNGGGTGEANNASQVQVLVAARPYPDLVVTAVSGPTSGLPGQSIPVVWTIRNNGTVPATNSWSDHLFLSADTLPGSDQFLASIQFSGTLNPSQTLTRTQLVTIPTFGTGARYFVAEVDANSQVFEDNDANNSFVAATPLQLQSSLTLTISPGSVQENAGAQAALATVTRNSAVTSPLTVSLSSSQPAKLVLPANVEIPLGASSANFYVGVVDDLQVGGDVVASITVQAAGHINGTNTLTVRENDSPALRLQLSASSVLEDAPAGTVTGRVIRNVNTNQALTVTLVSDNPGAMIVPVSVVIPIGQTNVTFNLDPVDDELVSGTRSVSIFASATGFSAVSAPINVLDDDSVALTLTLSDTNVTEGVINPAAVATLTRSPVSAALLRVRLGTNSGGLVQIPAEVTIPANQPGVSFPVNVRDDSLSFGAQTVNIVADGLATDGSVIPGSTAAATIRIQENDGPTLSVTAAVGVVAEGASTTVTITRNTPPTNALPVTLAAAPAGQASVPPSVVIAVGQFSTNVTLSGVVDGVSDGPREVTVSANSAGFNPGSGLITVTDIDVPDLALSEVSGPTNALTDGVVTAVWSVTNSGLATATGTWVDELLLATDAQGANASVILRVTNAAPIVVGDSYTVARSFLLPSDPGNYWLLVRTDATNSVAEGSERNNSMLSAPISVQPSYRATVSTTVDSAVSGTPIPLSGRTFFTSDGSPAPFRSATVRLNVNRVRRILQVVSDAAGNFQTTFHPIPGEAGVYTVGADHPRVRQDVVQDQFTLLGMSAVPWQISQRLAPNVEASGQIEIRNLSPLPLTGLVADSEGLPLDFNLTVAITNTLAGNATALLDFSFATTISTPVSGRFTLRVTSGEGAVVRIPVDFVVAPPTAQLVAEPASLNRGMLRGAQTTVQFDVVNRGGVASGDLTVALPVAPWLSLVSTSPIPSLAPGARSTVVLGLNPATNLPLTTYSGTIAILGGQTSLGIPFQFRALSEARGDLLVNATDEHTYFVSGAPKVTNATIVLRDPITHTIAGQSLTDSNGQARFLNLIEGPYILEASAPGHSSTRGGAMVVPGITTEQEVFLTQQSVRYEWKVVPTEIEDHYRVVIEPLFETEVPQPNLIVENPLIIPLVIPGQTSQFEIRLRNSGLIALQRVRIPVPSHPNLIITPLVTEIEELPALASVTVPVTIRVADGGTVADANGIQFRPASGGGCAGTECVVHMPIDTRYRCGPNFVTQQRDVTLQVVCVPDTGCQFDRVDITRVDFMTANNIAGNAEWDCLLGNMDECQKARVRGYLKFGDFGAVSGPFGDGISDFCGCAPPERIPQLFNTASNYMVSLGFNVNGFDPTIPRIDFGQVGIVTEVPCNQNAPFAAAAAGGIQPASSPPAGTPVCARVRLQLSQDMTLTRAAFRGTLVLENNGAGPLTDVLLEVDFRNAAGASASSLFAITGPTLAGGLTGVGGSGTLPAGGEGSAEYLFIPTQEAAPLSPTTYFAGGTLRYTEDGRVVTIRLLPGVITVLPEARLTLDYFLQRDVYSDDPFTPELEPAEPFALGLRARNAGAGAARNFRITSAQPRIIENEKGLAIDFQLLGARLGNQPLSPSFSQNLGNVEPGESKIVIWDMTSTLQGKFIDYRASFEHIDALGGRNLSLIESVSIHELIHVVRADRAGDDTLPDFLVNDAPDSENFPDVVYLSEGGTNFVSRAINPVVDSPPATNDLQVQLTVAMPAGFSYLRMTNPGPNFRLTGVRRSDGKQLLMGPNAWTTDRSFPSAGTGAVREKLLHLFDHNSSGSYTLTFAPINVDTNPPSSTIALLPSSSAASFALEWDGDDGAGSGIAFFDIFVSVNGGPFTNWLAHTTLRSGIFSGVMGNSYAFYSVATDLSGNRELIPTGPDAQTSTTGGANTVPSLVPIADVTINEGSLFSLVPTVFDSDVPQQTMTYSLTSSQPGATLDPSSGQITWTTGEAQGGTTNRFILVVTDNGLPSLSATQSFNVIVREVNSAPFFVNPVDIEVDEESSLSQTIGASDTDLPPNQLTWELAPGAPVGMSLNAANGLLTWLPGESRGPGEYLVSVTVRDNGSPVQSVTRVVRVVVREVNRAPVLAAIVTQTALVGSTLYVTNSATDPDVPAQEFFYSIAPGAPRGVRVERVTGVLSWTPSPAYARTTNSITVRVTDNGVPSLTDTETFQVIVGDYLEVRLGKAIVLAGQTSSVPVVVATTTPVTNATCVVEFPGTRLGSFNLSPPVAPLASATLQPITANRFLLRFTTLPGQQMAAEQTVSQLRFNAAADQSSAFVPLTVSNVTATQVNGQPVPRAGGADGRVVYLGPEPLLEMERVNTNGVQLVLYSRPSPSFSVQSTLSLNSPVQWLPFWSGASSNLIDVRVLNKTNAAQFFRATLP